MNRPDLLELTPAALTALANVGLVKRAQKEVAAGLLPDITQAADGSISAQFADGTMTRLPPGRALQEADCTCPASGMCRHRVMLVLAYQQQAQQDTASSAEPQEDSAWNPAHFDDAQLTACLAPKTLERAAQLAAAGPLIGLTPWRSASQPPTARLPLCSVRFFSRHALAHARCDCKEGGACEHVALALWAFRQAPDLPPDAPEYTLALAPQGSNHRATAQPLTSAAAQEARNQLHALLLALWLDGSSQPVLALSARIAALRAQVQALDWNWVDDALEELHLLLQAQHARSSRFEPQRLLSVVSELWARLHAAAHVQTLAAATPPPRHAQQILGMGVSGEVALDHLRLVSLGAVVWADKDREGIDILLADPDSQSINVLERDWLRAQGDSAAPAWSRRRIAGVGLPLFACGQIVTKVATRRANGRIDIKATSTRQTSVLPLSPSAWDSLQAPLRQHSVHALMAQLRQHLPDFALPRQAANGAATGAQGALHILTGHPLQPHACHWDAATQTLHAAIHTSAPDDPPLHLRLPHHSHTPAAVDALARALDGQSGALYAIAGVTWLAGGCVHMQPIALLTEQRALALHLEATAPHALPLTVTASAPPSPSSQAVQQTFSLLAQWLRQGLRPQGGALAARMQSQSHILQQAGLPRCAALLQTGIAALHSSEAAELLLPLSTLVLLLRGVG